MTQKRFIAGAVCPRCAAMDTMQTYKAEKDTYRECIECGFKEKMRFAPQVRELTTRVNISEAQAKSETQIIRLPDGSKKPDS